MCHIEGGAYCDTYGSLIAPIMIGIVCHMFCLRKSAFR